MLVTGGGGFLGQAICRQLVARGDEAVAFQRSPVDELAALGVEVRQGDIRVGADVAEAMQDCEAVIHTAGKAGAWGDPDDYHAINVTGTEHVIDSCRRHEVRRLVFTSSPVSYTHLTLPTNREV